MTLEGRDVVVTGANGGLGGAVVNAFVAAGARCHVPLRDDEASSELPWDESPQVAATYNIDLTDEAAVSGFYDKLPGLWASIHLVGGFSMAPLCDISLGDFERMMKLNASTCFLCSREAVKVMRTSGDGGRIVNITARPVLEPVAGMTAYAASKAAIASLTRTLAVELRGDGILVNAIVPSIFDTPANRQAMPEADFSSWPKPAELAETIRFLASPQNHHTSGSLTPVYGRA